MRKNLLMTICTFAIVGGTIAGSTGLTTFAAANNTGTSISAKKITQPVTVGSKSKVTISLNKGTRDAALRTSADMSREKATYIALEALEKEFNISLNGTNASPILSTTDTNEPVYFINFTIPKKEHPYYLATINSRTGVVIQVAKNDGTKYTEVQYLRKK